jgi:hypothetical protein
LVTLLVLTPKTAPLYSNRNRQISYDSDSVYDELDGSNSDNSFWYSNGYRALPFFIIKPKLKIEDCHIGTDANNPESQDCSFYLHNSGKRTAVGVRIKFKEKRKMPRRPKPPKLVREFGTLNPNFPEKLNPFDLDPDETISVRVCEVTKDQRAIFQIVQDDQVFRMPTLSLEKGRKHELLFRFVGRNFYDRRVWHLLLDLTHERPKFSLIPRDMLSQYLSDYFWNRG